MKIQWIMCLATLALAQANPMRDADNDIDGDPVINDYLSNLPGNLTTVKEALAKSEEVGKRIKSFLENANEIVDEIHTQINVLTAGQVNVTDSFMNEFNVIKSELRKARQELRILAHDTNSLTGDALILLDHNDELIIEEVEAMLESMKHLILRTKEQLTKAKEKYNNAIDHLELFQDYLQRKILDLDKNQNATSENVEKTCTGITIAAIVADIFGCFGICSATMTTTCWVAIADSLETFKQEIKDLKERMAGVDDSVQEAISGLDFELKIVNKWQSASGTLQLKLESPTYKPQILAKVSRIRNALVKNVRKLNQVANEYLTSTDELNN